MKTELMNKIIQYLMTKPYKEVFELMDEIRKEVEELNGKNKEIQDSETKESK
jgi:predicted DNA-binding ArsR family transcriptional regulator